MKVTRSISIDGKDVSEYEQGLAKLEAEQTRFDGWTLHKEPLIHRVTAVKVEEVDSL